MVAATNYEALFCHVMPGLFAFLFVMLALQQSREDVEPVSQARAPTVAGKLAAAGCCLLGAATVALVLIGRLGRGPSELRVFPTVCVLVICLSLAERLWNLWRPLVICAIVPLFVVLDLEWPIMSERLPLLTSFAVASAVVLVDLIRYRARLTRLLSTWLFPLGVLGMSSWFGMLVGLTLSWSSTYWYLALFAVAWLILSVFEAKYRRGAQIADLTKWLRGQVASYRAQLKEEKASGDFDVHAIAHSFGTFLTGSLLERQANKSKQSKNGGKSPRLNVDRIILVGSVLRTGYPWATVLGENSHIVLNQVRNEVGGRDRVVQLAGMLERAKPYRFMKIHTRAFAGMNLGDSGYYGFTVAEDDGVAHDVRNSLEYCETCRTREERKQPRVHNVWLPTFYHSDAFYVRDRCRRFWLPFLLGFEPWQYWDFRLLCTQAGGYKRDFDRCSTNEKQRAVHANSVAKKIKIADESAKPDLERALAQAQAEHKKAVQLMEAVKQQIEGVYLQLGERVWDWTHLDDLKRKSFEEFIDAELAVRMFDAVPDWPPEKVIAWVSAATPGVIAEIGSIVEVAQKFADNRAKEDQSSANHTDSSLTISLPRSQTGDRVGCGCCLRASQTRADCVKHI